MKLNIKLASSTAILLALAACGESTTTESAAEVSRIITGADALNIGTSSTTGSGNGLPFADLTLEELEALSAVPTLTVRLVRYVTDDETGELAFQVTEEVITLDITPDSESLTFTFAGETIVLDAETDSYPMLSDGTIIVPLFEAVSFGEFSAVLGVGTADELEERLTSAGVFVLGLETNPEDLPSGILAGSTEYYGYFNGIGTMLDGLGDVQQEEVGIYGDVYIEADFSDSTVDGELELWTDGSEGETIDNNLNIHLLLDEADIVGNGFSTTTTIGDSCDGTCENFSEVGGAFFGPTGEEISGVATIDYSDFTITGQGSQFVGVGGFTAQEDDFGRDQQEPFLLGNDFD